MIDIVFLCLGVAAVALASFTFTAIAAVVVFSGLTVLARLLKLEDRDLESVQVVTVLTVTSVAFAALCAAFAYAGLVVPAAIAGFGLLGSTGLFLIYGLAWVQFMRVNNRYMRHAE